MSVRGALVLGMAFATALVLAVSGKGQAESRPALAYNFEQGIQIEPSSGLHYIVDAMGHVTGRPHDGYLEGANGGEIGLVPDPVADSMRGTGARFPEPCAPTASAACPKAMIRTDPALSDDLNPGSRPFSFGAVLLMEPSHLNGGSNVVQKGLFDDPGGQWKLQVDSAPGAPGQPSCSARGVLDGESAAHVHVEAWKADVADGRWHRVVCRRTEDDRLAIFVDGAEENSRPFPPGAGIRNDAPLTVGAKHLEGDDNDQFHGILDRVFFRLD